MLSNVVLFTGEERFLLDKELLRRKQEFMQKFGSDAIFSFDWENFDIGIIKQTMYGGGLFVTKRMIIISGIPYEGIKRPNKEVAAQIDAFMDDLLSKEGVIPQDTILVFVSNNPDKRSKFYKFLNRNAMVKSFDQYKGRALKDFVISQLPGLFIPNDVIEYFLVKVGSNLYRLRFECEKLKIWCEVKHISTIDQAIIDTVSFGRVETNAFAFLDAMFVDRKKAIMILEQVKQHTGVWNIFAGMLYRSLRLSIYVVDFVAHGIRDSHEIASILSVSPWPVSKLLNQLKYLQEHIDDIKQFYSDLIELDYNIRSGKYPDSYFWLKVKKMLKE